MVILHELCWDPDQLSVALDVKRFDEETSFVAVYNGLNEHHARQTCLSDLQARSSKPSK